MSPANVSAVFRFLQFLLGESARYFEKPEARGRALVIDDDQ